MRDEQHVDLAHRHLELPQADRHAAPGVDDEFLVAGLDQRARAEAGRARRGRGGAEQRDLEVALRLNRRRRENAGEQAEADRGEQ